VTLSVPADCTLDSGSATVQDLSLTFGTPTELPPQNFSVTCTNPSFHDFTATVTVAKDDSGALESNEGNNSATSASSTTAVTGRADFEVTGLTLNAPATAVLGKAFAVDSLISYRNNGPVSPAVPRFDVNLSAPAGCSISPAATRTVVLTPPPDQTGANSLGVQWSVTCPTIVTHTFTVTVQASVEQLHVIDPNAGNDAVSRAAPGPTIVGPASLPQTGGSTDHSSNGSEGSIITIAVLTILLAALARTQLIALRRGGR
jgi:hypothetical protein